MPVILPDHYSWGNYQASKFHPHNFSRRSIYTRGYVNKHSQVNTPETLLVNTPGHGIAFRHVLLCVLGMHLILFINYLRHQGQIISYSIVWFIIKMETVTTIVFKLKGSRYIYVLLYPGSMHAKWK